jgi:MYXO-CTERM domain-containing protein
MRMRLCTALSAATFAALLGVSTPSRADECLLGPVAVPGLPGAPEWVDWNGDSFWRPELHDPRWSGAPLDFLSYVPGTGEPGWIHEVAVRVVADGKIVYISFQAQDDDTGPDANDYVYVGLSEGSGNGAYAIKINADGSGADIPGPADPDGAGPTEVIIDSPPPKQLSPIALGWWHTTNATVASPNWDSEQSGALPWLQGARWNRPGIGSPRWAITLRLDLSPAGLDIAGATRFFFGAKVNKSTGDILVGNAVPKTDSDTDRVGDTAIPHRSNQWVQYLEPGAVCTEGITLDRGDVGVWTGSPGVASGGSLTNVICAGGACGSGENVFRVTARNVDNSGGIGTWAIRARMRIADWGSTVAFWNFAHWTDVAPVPHGTDVFDAPTSDLSAGNGWYWLPAVDAGDGTSAVTIDYQCSKGGDDYCPKLHDESEDHQCMLVELGQPTGSTFKFRNKAVYRNMNYEDLSALTVPAKISLLGLKKALGEDKPRDVYLYVEQRNMPPHGNKALQLPQKDLSVARRLAENPIAVPRAPRKRAVARPVSRAAAKAAAVVSANAAALSARIARSNERLANGLPLRNALAMTSDQLLDAVWPTYRVRVYYDSGRTFTVKGKKNRVLIPMVPFGFRLNHQGALYGFTTQLASTDRAQLKSAGGNWYKLSLPSEGAVKVSTALAAQEKPVTPGAGPCPAPQPCPQCPPPVRPGRCNCRVVGPTTGGLAALAGALLVGGAFLLRRRSKRRKAQRER